MVMTGKFSVDVEHTCFLLWWETCGRDAQRVAVAMAPGGDQAMRDVAGLYGDEPGPSMDTIRRWAREKLWDLKAADKMREAAPWRTQAAAARIIHAQADAANYLADSITDPRKLDSSDRIRSDNAKTILAMGMGTAIAERLKPVIDRSLDLDDLGSKTPAELAELERKMLEG